MNTNKRELKYYLCSFASICGYLFSNFYFLFSKMNITWSSLRGRAPLGQRLCQDF